MEYLEYLIKRRNTTRCYIEWRRTQEIIDLLWLRMGMEPAPFSADNLIFERVRKELHGEKEND